MQNLESQPLDIKRALEIVFILLFRIRNLVSERFVSLWNADTLLKYLCDLGELSVDEMLEYNSAKTLSRAIGVGGTPLSVERIEEEVKINLKELTESLLPFKSDYLSEATDLCISMSGDQTKSLAKQLFDFAEKNKDMISPVLLALLKFNFDRNNDKYSREKIDEDYVVEVFKLADPDSIKKYLDEQELEIIYNFLEDLEKLGFSLPDEHLDRLEEVAHKAVEHFREKIFGPQKTPRL
jgi:hypothetical protein